jgi:hypothetical protein
MVQLRNEKKKTKEKNEESLRNLWNTSRWLNVCIMEVTKKEEIDREETYFKNHT